MNILLPAALTLLVAVLVGRRLRRNAPPLIDLDAPYELPVEMTPMEREAMWHRIEAAIDGERRDVA